MTQHNMGILYLHCDILHTQCILRFKDSSTEVHGPLTHFHYVRGTDDPIWLPFHSSQLSQLPSCKTEESLQEVHLVFHYGPNKNNVGVVLNELLSKNLIRYLTRDHDKYGDEWICHDFVDYVNGIYPYGSPFQSVCDNWNGDERYTTLELNCLAVGSAVRFTDLTFNKIYHSAVYVGCGYFMSKMANGWLAITDFENVCKSLNKDKDQISLLVQHKKTNAQLIQQQRQVVLETSSVSSSSLLHHLHPVNVT